MFKLLMSLYWCVLTFEYAVSRKNQDVDSVVKLYDLDLVGLTKRYIYPSGRFIYLVHLTELSIMLIAIFLVFNI